MPDRFSYLYPAIYPHEIDMIDSGLISNSHLKSILDRFLCTLPQEEATQLGLHDAYFIPYPEFLENLKKYNSFWDYDTYGFSNISCLEGAMLFDSIYYPVFSCVGWIEKLPK